MRCFPFGGVGKPKVSRGAGKGSSQEAGLHKRDVEMVSRKKTRAMGEARDDGLTIVSALLVRFKPRWRSVYFCWQRYENSVEAAGKAR